MRLKVFFQLLGPSVFFLMLLIGPPEGMSIPAFKVMAATLWIAIWWMTEAIPIAATSFLPLILYPITNAVSLNEIASSYANPIIYIFVGGFILALAMQKWNLHKRIALNIIAITGTNMRQIILGFILATAFLSMWISNTATAVMMLPIALSIITQFKEFSDSSSIPVKGADDFGKALILAIAYSASIGGIATLVGTPTNLIFADAIEKFYKVPMPFDQWIGIGLPISLTILVGCWYLLTYHLFSLSSIKVQGSSNIIKNELKKLGRMSYEEKWVLLIFSIVAFCWITRRFLITPFFPSINDTIIVMIGAIVLFLIPAKKQEQGQIMDWETAVKLPWAVILLFGGAFAVAQSFESSQLTLWIGEKLSGLENVPFWLVLLIVVAVVNFLTEITQNIATCTLMMPILAALSGVLNVHPYGLMAAAAIASSCAFMLPVATAPNAVVFGSGFLKMKDMVRAGFLLNVLSIIVVTLFIYFLLPAIWGIDLLNFPSEIKVK
ncbi:MAG: SLC13/DASS family transporter [Flammeovirgaceae bacterium]|nr:SLC13/DASS family transporter [Flammeovirgaceae bacterium]